MLSLELARKLKEAGLEWEPKQGDWFYRKDGVRGFVTDANMGDWWAVFPPDGKEVAFCIEEADRFIFASRLDQLLAEIDRQECQYILNNNFPGMPKGAGIELLVKNAPGWLGSGNSAEEVAAEALLWLCLKGS